MRADPALRHDAARRRAVGGRRASRSTTSCASPSELDDLRHPLRRGRLAGLESARRGVLPRRPRAPAHAGARRGVRRDAARGRAAADDRNLAALLRAETPVVTIVGKTWDLHVRDDLRISLEENLEVIARLGRVPAQRVDEVIFDAEHFFDGYARNPEYALACIAAAAEAGRRRRRACATRAAARCPRRSAPAVDAAQAPCRRRRSAFTVTTTPSSRSRTRSRRSSAGCVQVQGTMNGFGERCGNANLCSLDRRRCS